MPARTSARTIAQRDAHPALARAPAPPRSKTDFAPSPRPPLQCKLQCKLHCTLDCPHHPVSDRETGNLCPAPRAPSVCDETTATYGANVTRAPFVHVADVARALDAKNGLCVTLLGGPPVLTSRTHRARAGRARAHRRTHIVCTADVYTVAHTVFV